MAIKPGKYDPTKPDVELFDFVSKKRYGLKLDGEGAMKIGTVSQDDTVYVRNVGKRPGDFDEQRSWKSGRGIEDLSSMSEAFWDSKDAWTLTPGFAHQTLLWQFARGIVANDVFLPDEDHSVNWRPILGASIYLSNKFTSEGLTASQLMLWVRKVGKPADLTIEITTNGAGGVPGTVSRTMTLSESSVSQTLSSFKVINLSSDLIMALGVTRHIKVYAAATDNKNNRWEIGGYLGGANGLQSTDNSTWTASGFDFFFRLTESEPRRSWFSFFLDQAFYVVDSRDDQVTSSRLWINGDRGKSSSGTISTLVHSGKTWVTDRWANAWVFIVRGQGKGQFRQIASNTADTLTLTEDWDRAPGINSEYIIYSTPWFTELTTTGLGIVTSQPAVVNQIVYFPQGQSTNIRTMVWNATTVTHEYDDNGTNKADFITRGYHKNDGVQVWRAQNGLGSGGQTTVSRANASAHASPPADLSFKASIQVGDKDVPITNIIEKDGALHVFKWDGLYIVNDDVSNKLQNGIEKTPDPANGSAIIIHQKFMYYSWLHSFVRIYGSEHDDIGQDWKGYGLPDSREGVVSSFDSYTSVLFYSVNADTGTSSVLAFDGLGIHEVLRGYSASRRITMVKVQPCTGTRNFLWTGIGGNLVYQVLPLKKASPKLDNGMRYQHEAVIESCRIDMGTASGMPKFIKELTVMADNLSQHGREIAIEYQVDDQVHTNNWTSASSALISPESQVFFGLNNVRAFAYRMIIRCNNNSVPILVRGVTPNGFARTPYKMVWSLRCRADNILRNSKLAKSADLMRWLLDSARFPYRVQMKSQYELAHNFFVTIHPPSMFPYKPATSGQPEESVFTIVLEEM